MPSPSLRRRDPDAHSTALSVSSQGPAAKPLTSPTWGWCHKHPKHLAIKKDLQIAIGTGIPPRTCCLIPLGGYVGCGVSAQRPEQSSGSLLFVELAGLRGRPITVYTVLHPVWGRENRRPVRIGRAPRSCPNRGSGRLIWYERHNPIRIRAKGFGNGGKGGKLLTHPAGLIMMKWLIWVILEGLTGSFLLTGFSFCNRLFRFLTIQVPVCNTQSSWQPRSGSGACLARVVVVSVCVPDRMPKVFDTRSMERVRRTVSATSLDGWQG